MRSSHAILFFLLLITLGSTTASAQVSDHYPASDSAAAGIEIIETDPTTADFHKETNPVRTESDATDPGTADATEDDAKTPAVRSEIPKTDFVEIGSGEDRPFPSRLIVTVPPVPTPRQKFPRCGRDCRFTICGFRRGIISHPRLPITRPICARGGQRIGRLLEFGEGYVSPPRKNYSIPISTLRFNRTTPYRRDFFRAVPAKLTSPDVSSIGVRFLPRPALERLHGSCIRIPITKWEERGTERSGSGCVAFRIQVPTVMVELKWDTNDDLDLFVVEPDGTSVFFQDGGGSGHLLRDAGRKRCGKTKRVGGKETIVYYRNNVVKPGRYLVTAEHTKNCMERPTNWEIGIVVRGRLKRRFSGVSRLREGGVMEGSRASFVVE